MVEVTYSNDLRGDLTRQLIEAGLDASETREIVDLAFFATTKAVETVREIAGRAKDSGSAFAATEIALQLTAALASHEALSMHRFAKESGLSSKIFDVKGQFNG